MRSFFISLLFFYSLSSFSQTASDEQQVEALIVNSFDELFSSFKLERMDDFYTEDFILLEQGEIWDYEMVKNYFRRSAEMPQKPQRLNRFEFIKTVVDGDRAWTSYWNWAKITSTTNELVEIKWLESATAVRTSAGWRLDMLHSTRVAKPANE